MTQRQPGHRVREAEAPQGCREGERGARSPRSTRRSTTRRRRLRPDGGSTVIIFPSLLSFSARTTGRTFPRSTWTLREAAGTRTLARILAPKHRTAAAKSRVLRIGVAARDSAARRERSRPEILRRSTDGAQPAVPAAAGRRGSAWRRGACSGGGHCTAVPPAGFHCFHCWGRQRHPNEG